MRPAAAKRCGGLGFLFPGTESLYQNAAASLIGQKTGAFIGPRFVGDLEVVTPGAAIGSVQRGVFLPPRMAAARTTEGLFRAILALTTRFSR